MEQAGAKEATVAVFLRDPVVRTAAVSLIEAAGLRSVGDAASAQVCLTDDEVAHGPPTVLLVPATPAACASAVQVVMARRAHGAATDSDVVLLSTVVRSVAGGTLAITPRVVSLAEELPPLGSRELAVLRLLAEGIGLHEIARRLHVSHATVKRAVAKLFDAVGARSRVELVLSSRQLGLLDQGFRLPKVEPRRSPLAAAGVGAGCCHLTLDQRHDDL